MKTRTAGDGRDREKQDSHEESERVLCEEGHCETIFNV